MSSVLGDLLLNIAAEARRPPSPEQVAQQQLAEAIKRDAEAGGQSLRTFIQLAWPLVEPGVEYHHNWHIEVIAEHLEAVSAGEIQNLLINIPPRHGKSTICSVMWPSWEWTTRPTTKIIGASYAEDLAIRDTVKSRRVMRSRWYQDRWSNWRFTGDQNTKSRYDNDQGGHRIATSVGGSVTGEGADVFLIDDPHKLEHAHQPNSLKLGVTWVREVVPSRLNDQRTGRIVCIMQRLHQDDVSGALVELGYHHVCLPAEYEPRHPFVFPDDPRVEEGALLWPDRFGAEQVANLQASLGSLAAAGQLQQRPAPAEGGIFNLALFQRYSTILDEHDRILAWELHRSHHDGSVTVERVERAACRIIGRMDLAIQEKTTADYTVLGVAAITPRRDLILLDVWRDRIAGPKQPAAVKAGYARWLPSQIRIESVQYQATLVQALLLEGLPVAAATDQRDKITRALVAGVAVENRRWFLPMQAHWLPAFESEIRDFPNASHDDQVDVLAGLTEDASATMSAAWEDFMRKQLEGVA